MYSIDENGCWIRTKSVTKGGYSLMYNRFGSPRLIYAHRWSYEKHKEPIPEGFHIHHTCGVRNCMNPDHLIAVDPSTHRREIHGSSHCPRGHEYIPENLVKNKRGNKICKECHRLRASRYRMLNRDKINAKRRQDRAEKRRESATIISHGDRALYNRE